MNKLLAAVTAIALLHSAGSAAAAPKPCDFNEIVYVQNRMLFAQSKHVEWAGLAETYGDDNPIIKVAGGVKWHRDWIEDYTRTMTLIRTLVERC